MVVIASSDMATLNTTVVYVPQQPLAFKPAGTFDLRGYWIESQLPPIGMIFENGALGRVVFHLPDDSWYDWFYGGSQPSILAKDLCSSMSVLSELHQNEVRLLFEQKAIRRGARLVKQDEICIERTIVFSDEESTGTIPSSIEEVSSESSSDEKFAGEISRSLEDEPEISLDDQSDCMSSDANTGFVVTPKHNSLEKYELEQEILWWKNKCNKYRYAYDTEVRKNKELREECTNLEKLNWTLDRLYKDSMENSAQLE